MSSVLGQVCQRVKVLLAVITGVNWFILHVFIFLISFFLAGDAASLFQRLDLSFIILQLSSQTSCKEQGKSLSSLDRAPPPCPHFERKEANKVTWKESPVDFTRSWRSGNKNGYFEPIPYSESHNQIKWMLVERDATPRRSLHFVAVEILSRTLFFTSAHNPRRAQCGFETGPLVQHSLP